MKDYFSKFFFFNNVINLSALILLSFVLGTMERNGLQLFLILVTFLCAGALIKRLLLFTGIAIMIVSLLLTLKDVATFEKDNGNGVLKKYEFFIGKDKKESE